MMESTFAQSVLRRVPPGILNLHPFTRSAVQLGAAMAWRAHGRGPMSTDSLAEVTFDLMVDLMMRCAGDDGVGALHHAPSRWAIQEAVLAALDSHRRAAA